MSVINTNSLSLVAQGNLTKSQSALGTAIERLSSGLRINSAKDDAAGQAIANRMTSQIRGLNQAQRNANDGISLAQTTEGALNQINDNLQRIRELAVQAKNGTNSGSDLDSIQEEITARMAEITRVAEETDFNGTKVLDGSKPTITIQVGSDDGQIIDINLGSMTSADLGLTGFSVNGAGYAGVLRDVQAGNDGNGAAVTVVNGNNVVDTGGTDVKADYTLKVDEAGTYFAVDNTGAAFAVSNVTTDATTATAPTVNFTVDVTGGAIGGKTTDPLGVVDEALKTVDQMRSNLGAVQNRFLSAIENLQTTQTNISAARSRIEDADYAVEVANMTRAQILQQAGTSVLAQANQVPQGVLSLLR